MKFLLFILIAETMLVFGCSKADLQIPAQNSISSSAQDAANASLETESLTTKSRSDLLIAHPWMYKSFYLHYVDQSHKGDPQYVRGSGSNIIDLNDTRITFSKNGTFLQVEQGYNYPGTWQFTNSADTLLVMTYSYGANNNSIIKFNNNNLSYKKAIGSYSHGNFSYTELITAK